MKTTVLDITDLQKISPFFKTWIGKWFGNKLIKWCDIDKVNEIHAKYCHLEGAEFTSALLNDPMMDLHYVVHNKEVLETLPEGAFITVSNHPIGSLDGIVLIDIFASRRPDFCVMVNGVLTKINAMRNNFISVIPDSEHLGANQGNVNGVRASMTRLSEGHPMGFFPAGAMSFYNPLTGVIQDKPWTHSVVKLIRKAEVPVYPVFFDCYNSTFFYLLGMISWRIRVLRIPVEAFNKKRKTFNIYLGEPISVEEIAAVEDDDKLAALFYDRTYGSKKTQNDE